MSTATIYSRAISALEAPSVTVEVHLSNGLPAFQSGWHARKQPSKKARIACEAPS